MTEVIQIFKYCKDIHKSNYSTSERSKIGQWKTTESFSGFVDKDILYLPVEQQNNVRIKNSDLIIIQDVKDYDPYLIYLEPIKNAKTNYIKTHRIRLDEENKELLMGFSSLSKPWNFELFDFVLSGSDSISVYLNYPQTFGVPKRENHKLTDLKKGQTIRYKINSKYDDERSSRQRYFRECDYIIQHLGSVNKIEFKPLNKITIVKTIPAIENKLIDERKILK